MQPFEFSQCGDDALRVEVGVAVEALGRGFAGGDGEHDFDTALAAGDAQAFDAGCLDGGWVGHFDSGPISTSSTDNFPFPPDDLTHSSMDASSFTGMNGNGVLQLKHECGTLAAPIGTVTSAPHVQMSRIPLDRASGIRVSGMGARQFLLQIVAALSASP